MITVPAPICARVIATYGKFFEALSGVAAEKCGRDVLDEDKVHEQVRLFCRTFGLTTGDLRGLRLLEVGSGFGIFLAVLRRDYGVETYGIEPASTGFDTSLQLGREILAHYGLDPAILLDAYGEKLPFLDQHFDLIFSSTVLEHTQDPARVLAEAIRVLKVGGRMQFVYPNYGAFFDGHYIIPWIPYLPRWVAAYWVRLWGRDPAFVHTLRLTNYYSTRWWLRGRNDIHVITYGEEVFAERMLNLRFTQWAGLGRVKGWVRLTHRLRIVRPLTWLLQRIKSFDPIVLSLVKREQAVP